ncbi:DNA mismatch repair protein msh7 [Asimina triloba]
MTNFRLIFIIPPSQSLRLSGKMQRQKSILSFLQKPSSESPSSGASSHIGKLQQRRQGQFPPKPSPGLAAESVIPSARDLPREAFETETPPVKPQRRVLPFGCLTDDEAGVKPFSSIMRAFSIDDEPGSTQDRIQNNNDYSYSKSIGTDNGQGLKQERTTLQHLSKDEISPADGGYGVSFVNLENDPHLLEPETPAMRPLVPRVKRIQEDGHNPRDKCCFADSSKRVKLLTDFEESMIPGGRCEATGSKFEWLDPSMVRDADGRRPGDALYNKRTLYIPPNTLKKMSASQRQYWSVKCQYMDVVLFFKVGKFYELYELDAEIGHKELDWKITNSGVGKCRQVGISESGIDDSVQKLVARGGCCLIVLGGCWYKVGRMEQLETAGQAKARGANAVIERKLVHVFTPSTATDGIIGPDAVHLLALKEGHYDLENHSRVYGFAFLDYAALKIWVGSVCDDASCSALGALLVQISPKEVVYESKGFSSEAHKALKKYASAEWAMPGVVHVLALDFIAQNRHNLMLKALVQDILKKKPPSLFKWGSFILFESVAPCAKASGLDIILPNDIAISALGGLIDHLSRLMLHDALLNGEILPYQVYSSCVRMDGQTLLNLEIFSNNADGGPSGTLYKYLDNCITSAGKRLLRNWICHPLKNIGEINDRLNVVDSLVKHPEVTFIAVQHLRKLPDLERLLGRVKASIGNSARLVLPSIGGRVLKQQASSILFSETMD